MNCRTKMAVTLILVLLAGCALSDDEGSTPTEPAVPTGPPPPPGPTVWSADHETGDLSQWRMGQGESVFNTGNGDVYVTHLAEARSGRHSLVLSIHDSGNGAQAARIFRWAENPRRAYYGVWLYFPQKYRPAEWWNVFQFKSPDMAGNPLPTWVVNIGNSASEEMRFYLWDALEGVAYHRQLEGAGLTIPVAEWVHLEAYYERATDASGRIAIWQDGVLLFDLDGQRTALTDSIQWSVDNYTNGIEPTDVDIYADDADIRLVTEVGEQSD